MPGFEVSPYRLAVETIFPPAAYIFAPSPELNISTQVRSSGDLTIVILGSGAAPARSVRSARGSAASSGAISRSRRDASPLLDSVAPDAATALENNSSAGFEFMSFPPSVGTPGLPGRVETCAVEDGPSRDGGSRAAPDRLSIWTACEPNGVDGRD